jgi:hypothetical protein
MATPRHKRTTLSATPLRYEACSQSTFSFYYCYQVSDSYEATFYYCYQVSDATKPRSTAAKTRTVTTTRKTGTVAKSSTTGSTATKHVLLHIRSRQGPQQSRVLQPQRYRLRKPVTRTAVKKPVSDRQLVKLVAELDAVQNWVGLTPVNQAYYSGVVARR